MIFIAISIALLLLGINLIKNNIYDFCGIISSVVGGIMIIIFGTCLVCAPYTYKEIEIQRNNLQNQINISKQRNVMIDPTLTSKIVDINTKIETAQFYTTTVWAPFTDTRFLSLKKIQE